MDHKNGTTMEPMGKFCFYLKTYRDLGFRV